MTAEPAEEQRAVPRIVRREMRDFLRVHEQRRRLLPRSIAVGLLAGLVGVAFRASLDETDLARDALIVLAHRHPILGFPALLAFGALGAGLAVFLVRRFAPEASGSGIPHVKAVLYDLRSIRAGRIIAVKFAGGVAGIGAGLALGREGPTVQMGAAIGQMVSRWFPSTAREQRTLIAAGAGAGIAAAFNAPIAGLIFVLEEVQRDFAPGVFAASFVASATADVTTRLLLGQSPIFHVEALSIPPLQALPVSLVVGAAAGVLGVLFNRALLASVDAFQRMTGRPAWANAAAVGAAVGAIGWFLPQVLGGGNRLVAQTLAGDVAIGALAGFFLIRFALTMASYGCGAPGGIFAPLLVLGSEIGLAIGALAARLFPATIANHQSFAVVGMAAYFSAIVRAPLTGIVLIVEMTGNYSLVLPLLVACLTAYGLADWLRDRPVYEALLERELSRGEANPALEGTFVADYTIAPGAPFEGKKIRDLGLPSGCIVILVRRGLREEVPTADTALAAGDQITVVISPQAASAAAMLRSGSEAPFLTG